MGAYSTLRVTRDTALLALAKRLMPLSDGDLETALDRILDDKLYNVEITYDGGDDEEMLRALS